MLANGCTVNPTASFTKVGSTARFIDSGCAFVGQDQAKQNAGQLESIPAVTKKVLAETDKVLDCPK
jgi:hypothetical protein